MTDYQQTFTAFTAFTLTYTQSMLLLSGLAFIVAGEWAWAVYRLFGKGR